MTCLSLSLCLLREKEDDLERRFVLLDQELRNILAIEGKELLVLLLLLYCLKLKWRRILILQQPSGPYRFFGEGRRNGNAFQCVCVRDICTVPAGPRPCLLSRLSRRRG